MSKQGPFQSGGMTEALREIAALFDSDPAAAGYRARDILKRHPGQQQALYVLVSARRVAQDLSGARNMVSALAKAEPNLASLQYELGLLLRDLGDADGATNAFSRTVELEPLHPDAWRLLGDLYSQKGEREQARLAYSKHFDRMPPEEMRPGAG